MTLSCAPDSSVSLGKAGGSEAAAGKGVELETGVKKEDPTQMSIIKWASPAELLDNLIPIVCE